MKKPPAVKKHYKSFSGHGVDVAINRADDLDRLSLEYLKNKKSPKVLDLGCGAGGHSFRLTEAGALVTAIDQYDFSLQIKDEMAKRKVEVEQIKFICGDIVNLKELVLEESFSDVCLQRTLHYLNYQQALKLLKTLCEIVDDKLFISVTGIGSAAADNYPAKDLSIQKRFSNLHPVQADIFSIHEPVCLYSESEFVALLKESGWKIERSWVSLFGNIKAVCTH